MNSNKLLKLEDHLKSLPKQNILQSQVNIFETVISQISMRIDEYKSILNKIISLREISDDESLLINNEIRCKSSLKSTTGEISNLLNFEVVNADLVQGKLTSINRSISNLSADIGNEWLAICNSHKDRVSTFTPLVTRIDASSSARLKEVEFAIRPGVTSIPETDEDIKVIIDAKNALTVIMTSLKIGGPVEKFLQDAINGNGNPQSLSEPEVLAYLNNHPTMWNSLKVVLK
jgi:hypothetical protein